MPTETPTYSLTMDNPMVEPPVATATNSIVTYLLHKENNIMVDSGKGEIIINGSRKKYSDMPDTEGLTIDQFAEKLTVKTYVQLLSRHFENAVVLTGAGSSINIGTGTVIGKGMVGLWDSIIECVGEEKIKAIAETINVSNDVGKINLEDFLSKVNLYKELYPQEFDAKFKETVRSIEQSIVSNCTLKLNDNAPHKEFLKRMTSRKSKYNRLKLFTTNYDLLFEQAATEFGYVIIDGFSFTYPRLFNGNNFDYDLVLRKNSRIVATENYAEKVFHLYKLHGSLDWKYDETEKQIVKCDSNDNDAPIMIYPRSSKYETSYQQPFFEMMTRFQSELRNDNALLLIIGYSFGDKHINSMILEALNVNHSLQLVLVDYNLDNSNFDDISNQISRNANIMMIKSKFSTFAKNYPYADAYSYPEQQRNGRAENESV